MNETFEAFAQLPQNATYGQVLEFAENYFVSPPARATLRLQSDTLTITSHAIDIDTDDLTT